MNFDVKSVHLVAVCLENNNILKSQQTELSFVIGMEPH